MFVGFVGFCFYQPSVFFFFIDPATTEIYTLSLHDALPIFPVRSKSSQPVRSVLESDDRAPTRQGMALDRDRKSTRLNSSHANISYAVFCLKKKNPITHPSVGRVPLAARLPPGGTPRWRTPT